MNGLTLTMLIALALGAAITLYAVFDWLRWRKSEEQDAGGEVLYMRLIFGAALIVAAVYRLAGN